MKQIFLKSNETIFGLTLENLVVLLNLMDWELKDSKHKPVELFHRIIYFLNIILCVCCLGCVLLRSYDLCFFTIKLVNIFYLKKEGVEKKNRKFLENFTPKEMA